MRGSEVGRKEREREEKEKENFSFSFTLYGFFFFRLLPVLKKKIIFPGYYRLP